MLLLLDGTRELTALPRISPERLVFPVTMSPFASYFAVTSGPPRRSSAVISPLLPSEPNAHGMSIAWPPGL
jgi:hypothetical protein